MKSGTFIAALLIMTSLHFVVYFLLVAKRCTHRKKKSTEERLRYQHLSFSVFFIHLIVAPTCSTMIHLRQTFSPYLFLIWAQVYVPKSISSSTLRINEIYLHVSFFLCVFFSTSRKTLLLSLRNGQWKIEISGHWICLKGFICFSYNDSLYINVLKCP